MNLFNLFKKNESKNNQKLIPFGLDISGGSIKALTLEKNADVLEVKEAAYLKFHDSIIQLGLINDKTKVKELIQQFFKGRYFGNSPVLNIPEAQSFVVNIKINNAASNNNLKESVMEMAQKEIPFPLKETYQDFKIIKQETDANYILFTASPKVVINEYIAVLNSLNLKLSVFEIEPLSSFRAIKKGIDKLNENILIINIGYTLTNINIFSEGSLKMITYLPYGSNHVDELVAKKLNITSQESENLRKSKGINSKDQNFSNILKREVTTHIFSNIRKMIEFHSRENPIFEKFSKIILLGGFSLTPGLNNFIENEFRREVLVFNPFQINNINISDKFSIIKNNKFIFTQAVGLALRSLEDNFLNSDLNLIKNLLV